MSILWGFLFGSDSNMPWKKSDARRHTKKAKSAKSQRQWSAVANSILERTGDEGRAIRGANSVAKKSQKKGGSTMAKKRKKGGGKRRHK